MQWGSLGITDSNRVGECSGERGLVPTYWRTLAKGKHILATAWAIGLQCNTLLHGHEIKTVKCATHEVAKEAADDYLDRVVIQEIAQIILQGRQSE